MGIIHLCHLISVGNFKMQRRNFYIYPTVVYKQFTISSHFNTDIFPR